MRSAACLEIKGNYHPKATGMRYYQNGDICVTGRRRTCSRGESGKPCKIYD